RSAGFSIGSRGSVFVPVRAAEDRRCFGPAPAKNRARRQFPGCLPAQSARCQVIFLGATLSHRGQGHYLRCQRRPERLAEILLLTEYADRADHYRRCREERGTLSRDRLPNSESSVRCVAVRPDWTILRK